MGPRPIGRGNLDMASEIAFFPFGFNGATSNRTWKPGQAVAPDRERRASMGPRPIGRGNLEFWGGANHSGMLQWGHVQSDVETRWPYKGACINRIASMGPRPIGRGNGSYMVPATSPPGASMGPRPIGRGNAVVLNGIQLGFTRFNGATSNRTWKPVIAIAIASLLMRLQWGHVQSDVETTSTIPPLRWDSASMGPRPIGRGNHNHVSGSSIKDSRFNGATSNRTWKPGGRGTRPTA